MSTADAEPLASIDHLVLAAATLADGIDYVASLVGATPKPGGQHLDMGTHNALLRLGERLYLEVIAIDPTAAKPSRRRWFGLDDVALQSELTERPRLIHWVARTRDIDSASARAGMALGPVRAFSRGEYRWRITVSDDGVLPGKGLVPALIQWDVPMHPADALAPSNVALLELAGTHPDPNAIRPVLRSLGLERSLRVSYDREPRLAAMLRTGNGIVTVAS